MTPELAAPLASALDNAAKTSEMMGYPKTAACLADAARRVKSGQPAKTYGTGGRQSLAAAPLVVNVPPVSFDVKNAKE